MFIYQKQRATISQFYTLSYTAHWPHG